MGQRGRESAASMSVAADNTEKLAERPKAPYHLTPEQSLVWDETVKGLPADWFRPETLDTLAHYCCHVNEVRRINELIECLEVERKKYLSGEEHEFHTRDYLQLVQLRAKETAAANAHARSMRMTLQSTYDRKKKRDNSGKTPWGRSNA